MKTGMKHATKPEIWTAALQKSLSQHSILHPDTVPAEEFWLHTVKKMSSIRVTIINYNI